MAKKRKTKQIFIFVFKNKVSSTFQSFVYQYHIPNNIWGTSSFPNKCIQTITVTACVSSALLRDGVLLPPSAETAPTFHCRSTVKTPIKNSLKR